MHRLTSSHVNAYLSCNLSHHFLVAKTGDIMFSGCTSAKFLHLEEISSNLAKTPTLTYNLKCVTEKHVLVTSMWWHFPLNFSHLELKKSAIYHFLTFKIKVQLLSPLLSKSETNQDLLNYCFHATIFLMYLILITVFAVLQSQYYCVPCWYRAEYSSAKDNEFFIFGIMCWNLAC